jgi:hypothetical protein
MRDYASPSSDSILWKWATKKYASWSWERWSEIPYHITNSTYLVNYYAKVIVKAKSLSGKKILVIEWGVGSGCLAYRMLSALSEDVMAHYVCFDIQPDMPEALSGHPSMKKYYESGRVSFAVQRIEALEDWVSFLVERFDPELYHYVFIFNYLFDALPTDIWYTSGGALVPAALVTEAPGTRDWLLRSIDQLEYHLVLGEKWIPDKTWYVNLLTALMASTQEGITHNVPIVAIEVCRALAARLPSATWCITDIPMQKVRSPEIQSPLFVDGMLGSVFDFEVFSLAMKQLGLQVLEAKKVPGVELHTVLCSSLLPLEADVLSDMSLATYSVVMKKIREDREKWSFGEMMAYMELCHDDAWLLDTLVSQAAGCDVQTPDQLVMWLDKLERVERGIYWMPGSKDWLDLATLYRWQKSFDKAYEALRLYAQYQGYDAAYWYCIGFWLYDQNRYYDAMDAWQNAIAKNSAFQVTLAHEIAQATARISEA